jgi:hypothetical protein
VARPANRWWSASKPATADAQTYTEAEILSFVIGEDDAVIRHRLSAEFPCRPFSFGADAARSSQAAGRVRARKDKTEHVIHIVDGTIGRRNSYCNDPYPPKG